MHATRELLQELRTLLPADPTEGRHQQEIVELLERSSDPFCRNGFDPGHITAGCFIIDSARRRILLHFHRRLQRWLQMGGHVDPGETAVAAALREGAEESGLSDLTLVSAAPIDVDVHAIPAGKGEPAHHHFDVRYLASTRQPQAIALQPGESENLAWVDLPTAIELMNEEASRRVIAKIERLMA